MDVKKKKSIEPSGLNNQLKTTSEGSRSRSNSEQLIKKYKINGIPHLYDLQKALKDSISKLSDIDPNKNILQNKLDVISNDMRKYQEAIVNLERLESNPIDSKEEVTLLKGVYLKDIQDLELLDQNISIVD